MQLSQLKDPTRHLSFKSRPSRYYMNYLITESEVVTGKSQTEALPSAAEVTTLLPIARVSPQSERGHYGRIVRPQKARYIA